MAIEQTDDDEPQNQGSEFEPTVVYRETWEADRRLSELRLDRRQLLDVAAIALAERSHAGPLHCANSGGTFAYHHGTFALRDKHKQQGWAVDRAHGVESIRHDELKIKVAYTNVDIACESSYIPQPRSEKRAGSERAALGNLFGDNLPHFAPRLKGGYSLYYLMVGEDGRTELTRPIVRARTFAAAVERIFLGSPEDGSGTMDQTAPNEDAPNNYEPVVTRKAG